MNEMHHPAAQKHFSTDLSRVIALVLSGLACLLFLVVIIATVSALRVALLRTTLAVFGATPPRDANGYTNVLLLGVGDEHHDGADLTDTMMIASIDPASQSAVLLSIPRDLYITQSETFSNGRINSLYSVEKSFIRRENKNLTDEEISLRALRGVGDEIAKTFGIEIHEVVKGDFTAFTSTVDALGGVDVVVEKELNDYSYPLKEGVVGLFHLDAGPQHLDGETALRFARSRHSGTDFDRSARQQQLISAITQKIRTMDRLSQLGFVTSVLRIIANHVETTMSTRELMGLTQIGTTLSRDNVIMMQINFNSGGDYADAKAGGFLYAGDPALYEGASVLLPVALPTDATGWKQMETFASMLIEHRDLYLARPQIQVINTTTNTLVAYRLENELRRYGFTVVDPPRPQKGAAKPALVAESFITFSRKEDKHVAGYFSQLLKMPVSQVDDETATGSLLRIIVGKDFTYQPFQSIVGTAE